MFAPSIATRHSVTNKLLLILLVPMLFQFAAGSLMMGLISEDERLRREERNLSELTEKSGRQIALFGQASINLLHAQTSGMAMYFRKAENNFEDLLKSAEDDPPLLHELRVFRSEVYAHALERASAPKMDDAQELANSHVFFKEAEVISQHFVARLAEMRGQLNDARRLESQNREVLRTGICLSVILEIILSIGLAVWIIGGTVTSRLRILVANAYKLPRGMTLDQSLKGQDELSYLDKVLHEAEQYLKEANEQRSMLMEMLAHDMRSPLMAAQVALDLVTNAVADAPDVVQRNAIALRRNLGTVINLVNDLLTLDRLEAGGLVLSKTTFDLNTLVEEVTESLAALAAAKQIKLCNSTPESVHLNADRDRVAQVLTNLIANAVKFSGKEGVITITAAQINNFMQVCVSDEGPGLPAGGEKKIFEKFNQVTREHAKAGYGLGLTICKMIVELHGGTIAAQSLPEKGSRFCFSLPT